ncbi:MAG: hypothetical protein AAF965_00245 [Pseudomonadota bacterium]
MPAIALFMWPVVSVILFHTLGREKGLIWTVVAGYLLLPESFRFDLPGLPPYGKLFAIALGAGAGYALYRHKKSWPDDPEFTPDNPFLKWLLGGLVALIFLQIFMTVQNNGSMLFFQGTRFDKVRQAVTNRDLISMFVDYFTPMVPFFLAWFWLRSPRHHREVMRAVVIMGAIYAFLALWEMRFSPRVHITVYGYFPHDWRQHVRGGQFRPVVFLQHGLWLAFFLLMAAFAAYALTKEAVGKAKVINLGIALWITAVLLVSPNLGVAVLLFGFAPLMLLGRALQVRVIWVVTLIFLTFPALRQADLLPLDGLLNLAAKLSEERAGSLEFRFENEDELLARALQKPYFGWGGWGRSRVVDERGLDVTVADGLWVIVLGERGWAGYIGYFGILTAPLLLLARVARRRPVPHTTTAMGLIMVMNLIYLVPNSALSPIGWLLSGAVAGFIAWKPVEVTAPEAAGVNDGAPEGRPATNYTRFRHDKDRGRAVPLRRPRPGQSPAE